MTYIRNFNCSFSDFYHFVPTDIETFDIKLVKEIGKKIQDATSEKLSTFFLFQSISMAIQQGNAVCLMGCPKDTSTGFNFQACDAEEL